MKECPYCAELIEDSSLKCPFCNKIQENKEQNTQKTVESTPYKPTFPWRIVSIISLIICALNIYMGIYKTSVYENDTFIKKNAYVGGDAYNFIINSNYATGYFTLATIFAIFSIGCIIIYYLDLIAHKK